jgi:hypothetical protein
MHKSATKCNETLGKWCKNKHGASKIMDTLETYQSTSRSADRRRLLEIAIESSPSAHSFAKLIRWSMVLGLHRPSSSLKSHRMRPSRKALMALLGKMFSNVFRRLSHREMYDLRFSPVFCTHRHSSSNDVGHREVPQKFSINACRNSSQE